MKTGTVFDIQHFCIHDGPGIRTTVFLKGCCLKCKWCHNPESQKFQPEIMFHNARCTGCQACAQVCKQGVHFFRHGIHNINRAKCKFCFKCTDVCLPFALEKTGKKMTVEDVIVEVKKDIPFYKETGGGITVSGGEPMSQPEFTYELLKRAGSLGINRCMETCGTGTKQQFLEIVNHTDLFLWDIKDTVAFRHKTNTGSGIKTILSNLRTVDSAGGKTILRCLLISNINLFEKHLLNISKIYHGLKNCLGVEILVYHSIGKSKYEKLGVRDSYKFIEPTQKQTGKASAFLKSKGVNIIC